MRIAKLYMSKYLPAESVVFEELLYVKDYWFLRLFYSNNHAILDSSQAQFLYRRDFVIIVGWHKLPWLNDYNHHILQIYYL